MTDQRPDQIDPSPDAAERRPAMDAPGQGIDARIDVETAGGPEDSPDQATDQNSNDGGDSPIDVLFREGADAPDAADIEDPDQQL